jgi:hypothetical protein
VHYFSTLCSSFLLNFFLLNSILMREGSRLLTKIIKNVKKSNYSLIYENFTFKRKIVTKYEHWYPFLCSRIVVCFVTMRPAGTWCICELYWHSITKVSIIIPSTRFTLPPGLSQNPRGISQPRITLTSQAQGTKIHPHNLPDLLSGRGLTHEGPCLKMKNEK